LTVNTIIKSNHLFPNFNKVLESKCDYYIFQLDCSSIPSFKDFNFDKRGTGHLENFFKSLDKIHGPALYWFECEDISCAMKAKTLIAEFKSRKSEHLRTVPALNKNVDSQVLYVGVRRGGVRKRDGFTNIGARMFQHLGYYSKGSTQGLQLVHWTSDLKLKVHILALNSAAKPFLNVLEKLYAIELNPLVGKH